MPTYQYACTACDHRFDAVQSFTESSLAECPECPGALRKVFSSVGIVFKGSGFYRTDSRAGAGSTVAKGESKSESSSSDSSSKSSDGSSKNGSSDGSSKGSSTGSSKGKEGASSSSSSSGSSSSSSSTPAAAAS